DGGADIIDAKEPASGALGAVDLDTFERIVAEGAAAPPGPAPAGGAGAGARTVTAALGDAVDERAIARMADAFARAGARLVKLGFAGIASPPRVMSLLAAAPRGAAQHPGRALDAHRE